MVNVNHHRAEEVQQENPVKLLVRVLLAELFICECLDLF